MSNKLIVGEEVSIQMKDGYFIDRCVVEGVGSKIGMVSHHKDKEGVILNDIAQVNKLKPSAKSATAPRKAAGGKTKKEVAIELHKQYPNAPRKEIIEMLVEQAGMSKPGAATYYQNIWRAKC